MKIQKAIIFLFLLVFTNSSFGQSQIVDKSPPPLYFKYNSIEMFWDKSDAIWGDTSPEKAIDYYAKTLTDNPKIIIQVSADCDSLEKNTTCLSKKRAKFLKEELVKRGINSKRIKTKGFGKKRQIKFIYKAQNKEEEEYQHQKNRRASISILSWDYKTK